MSNDFPVPQKIAGIAAPCGHLAVSAHPGMG